MRFYALIMVFMLGLNLHGQSYHEELIEYRKSENAKFKDPDKSPLPKGLVSEFDSLSFFAIDSNYRVIAEWTPLFNQEVFEMPTSTERKPKYRRAGFIDFTLKGETFRLTAFQNMSLLARPGFEDYLFIPFADFTNGESTYGGGRYVEASLPKSGSKFIEVDFNKAYNPYCAYDTRFSCPLVPDENKLEIEIKAGVKHERKLK